MEPTPAAHSMHSATKTLSVEDQAKVNARTERLVSNGWDQSTAELLAMGELPEKFRHWPAKPRYWLAELTRKGRNPAIAEGEVRDRVRRWFRREHPSAADDADASD